MKITELATKFVGALFIIVFLFVGLKGCVITIWSSPKNPEIYAVEGKDGRIMTMIFLPNNETMIWHIDPKNESTEGVLTKMLGSVGTHYFWRLWHLDAPGIIFGYRIYPRDTEPVMMEITVLEKYMIGSGKSGFPEKGHTGHQVLLFGKDTVDFQGMLLKKMPPDPMIVQTLLTKLGGSKVGGNQ